MHVDDACDLVGGRRSARDHCERMGREIKLRIPLDFRLAFVAGTAIGVSPGKRVISFGSTIPPAPPLICPAPIAIGMASGTAAWRTGGPAVGMLEMTSVMNELSSFCRSSRKLARDREMKPELARLEAGGPADWTDPTVAVADAGTPNGTDGAPL